MNTVRNSLDAIVAQFRLRIEYPSQALAEAREWVTAPGTDDPTLEDLTALPFVTIDNPDSRDLDQAMHIEPQNAGVLVRYALADASYYVLPGSALFEEALARGASYYLPGYSVPMLPRELSEGIVSLNEGQVRRALVVALALDERGNCVETRFFRARIQSAKKLSYAGVQRYYDAPEQSPLTGQAFTGTLDLLRQVGQHLMDKARARNVVAFNRSETTVHVTDDRFVAVANPRMLVERYNEQISLLCNVEGARLLAGAATDPHTQAVYRVHPAPPPEQLDRLVHLIEALVAEHGLDNHWRWRRDAESLADYLERLPQPSRISQAVERQALLTNLRSVFSEELGAHFGIGAPFYARFSSPMREIVGIFTHKEALEHLGLTAGQDDSALREQVITAANRAKETQRQLEKAVRRQVIDALFAPAVETGDLFSGTVMGVKKSRFYVQLDQPPVEVKVYVTDLEAATGHQYEPDDVGVVLRPAGAAETAREVIRLGDHVRLRVTGYNKQRHRWRLTIG